MSSIGHKPTNFKHGLSSTSEFYAWVEMRRRCTATGRNNSKHYADRGIKVCDRWLGEDGFTNFILDMDWKPTDKYTLDRIDPNGNYEPDNCRWATQLEQQNNRRKHTKITIGSTTKNISEWCAQYDIPINTFINRLQRGWTGYRLIVRDDFRQSATQIKYHDL